MIQHGSQPPGYERKVRTVPLTRPLQIGHFRSDGAHSLQTTRCPHGMKTMLTSLSMHTLQVRSSWRRRSCSSMGRSAKKKTFMIPYKIQHVALHSCLFVALFCLPWKRVSPLLLFLMFNPFYLIHDLSWGSRCHCCTGCKSPWGKFVIYETGI